ncbi:hypothetical protein [Nonomuraea basaltis]|uniref:hypothetical protein n=1 Tax=Nonomuraea basaltis TaxID=2495887 RepID=UPI00110C5564|nr:hypothetical protein [Nonomuraea basaltis]TMR97287.1 hypothetical protein EJK15_18605 [Nonomuraea basaltis]
MTNQRTWTIGGVTYTADLEAKARRLRNAFDPEQPRDRKGRWIETGASVSIWGGGTGTVARNLGGGRLEVHTADGRKLAIHRNYLTVTAAPDGKKPSGNPADRPRPQRAAKPSKDVQEFTPSGQDTRVPVSELRSGQLAYVHGWDQFGDSTSNLGRISGVSPAGPPEDADTKPGSGWAVSFVDNVNRHWTMYTTDDAMARIVPDEDFARLVEAERVNDQEQADRIAREIRDQVKAIDEAEASAKPEAAPPAELPAVDSRVRLSNGAEGTVAKTREDGALLVRLDSGSQVNAHAADVEVIDTPAAPAESGGERPELRARQWISTPAFQDPVRVEQIQDTLTGVEAEVTTIRGDRRTLPEEELGDWQPADEPANHRADGAPVTPQIRPQEGLFADMGTDKDGNRDIFMELEDEDGQPALATAVDESVARNAGEEPSSDQPEGNAGDEQLPAEATAAPAPQGRVVRGVRWGHAWEADGVRSGVNFATPEEAQEALDRYLAYESDPPNRGLGRLDRSANGDGPLERGDVVDIPRWDIYGGTVEAIRDGGITNPRAPQPTPMKEIEVRRVDGKVVRARVRERSSILRYLPDDARAHRDARLAPVIAREQAMMEEHRAAVRAEREAQEARQPWDGTGEITEGNIRHGAERIGLTDANADAALASYRKVPGRVRTDATRFNQHVTDEGPDFADQGLIAAHALADASPLHPEGATGPSLATMMASLGRAFSERDVDPELLAGRDRARRLMDGDAEALDGSTAREREGAAAYLTHYAKAVGRAQGPDGDTARERARQAQEQFGAYQPEPEQPTPESQAEATSQPDPAENRTAESESDQAVRERAAGRQQVTALARQAREAYDAGDIDQASRLLDEAEQLAPGDPRLSMIRNTISEAAQPPAADGTPSSPLTYRRNASGGVDIVREGEVLGDVVKRGRTSWYWRVVGDENYIPVPEATRKAAAEKVAWAVETRAEFAAHDARREAARDARIREIEAEGYTRTPSSELQPGDMLRHLAGTTALEYWSQPVLVSQVQPFGDDGSIIRYVRMDGTTDIAIVSGERAQVMRKPERDGQADAVWQQHLDDTDDSPAAHARRAIPEGYEPAGWSEIQPEDAVRVPRRIRAGYVLEWSSPQTVEHIEFRPDGGVVMRYETSTGGRYIATESGNFNQTVASYGVIRDESTPRLREASREELAPAAGVFSTDGEAAVREAVDTLTAELDKLPMSGVHGAREDLRAALDRAVAGAPDADRAAAEGQRILQVSDVLGRAWNRASREEIARAHQQMVAENRDRHLAEAQAASVDGNVEEALRLIGLAETLHRRWLADQPAPGWEALRAAAERGPEPDAEPSREGAPEGQAYADEIRVGDTLAEARWRVAGPGAGALREGESAYANPAGPARLGEPERDNRRVADIQQADSGRLMFVFDDGTRISRRPDALVTRGTPAETEGGEWIPQANAQTGDRIQFDAAGPTLPAALAREGLGIGRFDKVTVAGKISRRQPGMPSVVLDDVTITRADGTSVPAPSGMRFSVPRRVLRLDDSEPAPAPEQVPGAGLREGDRITGPTGDVAVVRVEQLNDGLVSALVRGDDDRRERHLITADRPVKLAPAQDGAQADEVEASGLAVGEWVLIDDVPMQVASVPEVDGGRARFDVRDQDGRLSEMELDERLLLNRITGTPALDPAAPAAPPAEPERVTAVELPGGTPTGRVRLRTDQRRRLLDLNLDATSSGATPEVVQAMARLRARRELSAGQMQALAAHLRTLATDENAPAPRRRALARTAGWIDAANARLEGFPPPPHDPGRPGPERAYARNLGMGDVIALPGEDGTVRIGTVTATRPVRGFGLNTVHVRMEDGSVEQRVLPDGVDLWLMPDLPEDQPAPPQFTREHVTADRIGVGDVIRWDGNDFTDPVVGEVLSVERRGGEFAELRLYEMTVLDGDDEQQTITVTDRGWPSVERLERGPATGGQPYDSVMAPETAEYIDWRDLKVGDRATVSMATGTIVAITRHPATDDVPEGVTVSMMADSGEQRSVSVFDDPDRPDDYIDPSVMRLIPADDNAAARIAAVRRERERISREREFTAFLADLETSRSRWAATDIAEALRGLPAGAGREEALAAALERLDRIDAMDDTSAATLAFRLGARDDTQTAAMAPATSAVTGAVKARATARIRAALEEAALLGSETWPRALSRVAAAYRDHPPAPGVLPAGVSLARLRDRISGAPEQPAPRMPDMPQDADLPVRLAAYRAQLPDDLVNLGRQPVMRTVFEPTTLEDLEAGRVPAVRQAVLWAPDVADDDGPGPEAMRQLAVLRAAGADLDVRFRQHLASRDAALGAELAAVQRERGQAWKAADDLDAEITRVRRGGGTPDAALLEQRDDAAARWHAAAVREQELRRMLAEARREALAATLAEVRQVGGTGLDYTDRNGRTLTGRAGSNAAALRYVEEVLPADWLAAAREAGPAEVVTGPGQHVHVRADGSTRISLPTDDNTEIAPAIREGQPGRVPVPSAQPGGVTKATVAAHELGHHLEATVPGLHAAGQAMLWDRTSHGDIGDRVRPEPMFGEDRGRPFEIYPGDFPDARTGRVNGDGTQEVFANVLESLAGHGDYADDDLRHWGLGVLSLLATDATGPQGGSRREEGAERRDPLDGINLLALSDEQLRALLARIDDPQAVARLRAVLDEREQRRTGRDEIDLTELSDAELESMLLAGWDGYGDDPDRTALQDRVIAETEAREAERRRRGDELGDLAASDLLSMDTDDLAALYGRNLGRYGLDPAVTGLLDQISAELEERDRRRDIGADPYANLDLAGMSDEQLGELLERHQPLYHSDPWSAALVRRIFAELDDRHRQREPEDERTPEEVRVDELIAQNWDPREAYAEVYGLSVEEMDRQERIAIIDAERGRGERREQVVRRMYKQWVYEQALEAEKATNGYMLSPLGRKAGVDPKKLWGGNADHAYAYASEELQRWWAALPNGGRMTYEEWRAQWLGDSRDRRQAQERRQTAGNGRDFG